MPHTGALRLIDSGGCRALRNNHTSVVLVGNTEHCDLLLVPPRHATYNAVAGMLSNVVLRPPVPAVWRFSRRLMCTSKHALDGIQLFDPVLFLLLLIQSGESAPELCIDRRVQSRRSARVTALCTSPFSRGYMLSHSLSQCKIRSTVENFGHHLPTCVRCVAFITFHFIR